MLSGYLGILAYVGVNNDFFFKNFSYDPLKTSSSFCLEISPEVPSRIFPRTDFLRRFTHKFASGIALAIPPKIPLEISQRFFKKIWQALLQKLLNNFFRNLVQEVLQGVRSSENFSKCFFLDLLKNSSRNVR